MQYNILKKRLLPMSCTFTADPVTDLVTLSADMFLHSGVGPFQLTTTGALPAGLAPATNYWWISGVVPKTGYFAASAYDALRGNRINITDAGAGVHTLTPGVGAGTVYYLPLPMGKDVISAVHIGWHDATSNAAIVLETTCLEADDAEDYAVDAWKWAVPAGVVITGPSAVAAGAFALDLGNHGASRYRFKITLTAASTFSIGVAGKR